MGLSPLAGRSAVAPGLPKGAKGMSLALRAALNLRTTRALFSCDQHSEFRAAERCERRPRGPHSRPRRPATANQANRPTPEKPELCSCLLPRQFHSDGSMLLRKTTRGPRLGEARWSARPENVARVRRGSLLRVQTHAANRQPKRSNRNYTKRLAPRRDHAPDLLQRLVDDAARPPRRGLLAHAL